MCVPLEIRRLIWSIGLLLTLPSWGKCDDPIAWVSAARLDAALNQGLSIFRERAEAREMLERLSHVSRVACLLDRRIDPSTPVSLQRSQVPLRLVIQDLADQLDAATGFLGATVLLGQREELDRLLTAAAVRKLELQRDRDIPAARRLMLARAKDIVWQDLDRPVDVLQRISEAWSIQLANVEDVPHDLWAGGTAADVDVVEALSLVLGQFDLSFEWVEAGAAVRVIPVQPGLSVARTHRPVGMSREDALRAIQAALPDVVVRESGTALEVVATALQQDEISRLLGEVSAPPLEPQAPTPLNQRRFPVRIVRKPVGAILQALQSQGIDVQYDAAALQAAGVDLQTLVSLEFDSATAEEFFAALCEPAGLDFTIDGATVRIRGRTDAPPPTP